MKINKENFLNLVSSHPTLVMDMTKRAARRREKREYAFAALSIIMRMVELNWSPDDLVKASGLPQETIMRALSGKYPIDDITKTALINVLGNDVF